MRLLLDTHPLVWFLIDPKRIPEQLMAILVDPAKMVYVSAVAVWEATVKVGIGKVALPLDELGATSCDPVSASCRSRPHMPRASTSAAHPPFDRLMVAQARHEGLTLVTRDPTVRRYPIDTLWD